MVAETLEQLPKWAALLVESERVAHLGMLDGELRPRVLPVTYARYADAIWTIIDNKPKRKGVEPARLRWLRNRPQAALTIDRYDENWSALAWIQLIGDVAVLEVEAHGAALAALTHRYPQYELDPPPGPLLRLLPRRVIWWQAMTRS